MSKKYIITHYIRQNPDEIGWMPLPFITQIVDYPKQNLYYLAFNDTVPISQEVIDENVELNYYKVLKSPIITDDSQFLWISPSNDIWLGLKENPFNGHKQLIETEFSVNEIKDLILRDLLVDYKVDPSLLSDPSLPFQLKKALKLFIEKITKDPSIAEIANIEEISIIDRTYIADIDNSITKLKDEIKSLNIGLINDPTDAQVFEATENKVYSSIPTLFLYPFFLDEIIVGDKEVGVIQYGSQTTMAIAIHKRNEMYYKWEDLRNIVRKEYSKFEIPYEGNNVIDMGISIDDSKKWLINFLEFQFNYNDKKNLPEIHSVRGCIFHSIIQQFAKKHIKNFRKLGEILKNSTDTKNFTLKNSELPFYRKPSPSSNLNINQVLLLDPTDALQISKNGKISFNSLWKDYDIIYVQHDLDIPVGIGFSLVALPKILANQNWKKMHDCILEEFHSKRDLFRKIGIDLDPLANASTSTKISNFIVDKLYTNEIINTALVPIGTDYDKNTNNSQKFRHNIKFEIGLKQAALC